MIDAWIDFASFYLGDIYPLVAYKLNHPHNVEAFDAAKEKQHYAWTSIEKHLNTKSTTFLLGERVTLADIIFACSLYLPLQFALDTEFRIEFPKTETYLLNLLEQQQIKKILGDVHFLEKFTAP
jgi:elongation factor 1-gamma